MKTNPVIISTSNGLPAKKLIPSPPNIVRSGLHENQKHKEFAWWSRIILLIVLAYEAAGGLSGGALLFIAPDGHLMDMPVELMRGFFPNFLIPGIILFAMGILSTAAFFITLKRRKSDWLLSSITLIGWVIWFVTEILILQELHWLHIMWGVPVLLGIISAIPLVVSRNDTSAMQKLLLYCGILSSLWYVIINIYVPLEYDGYDMASYTVSELSAIGAPTRILWVLLVLPYPLLFAAFGWGVLRSAPERSPLRMTGSLIIAYSLFNLFWPPMHMRGQEFLLTDALHITWAFVTVLLMIIMMLSGITPFEKSFRTFTILSLGLLVLFGVITGLESPNIAANGPTPSIGIWERINIGIFLLWVTALSIMLTRREKDEANILKDSRN